MLVALYVLAGIGPVKLSLPVRPFWVRLGFFYITISLVRFVHIPDGYHHFFVPHL